MDQIVDQIRAALVPGASPAARAEGATACLAVLAALEASPNREHERVTNSATDRSSSAELAPDSEATSAPTLPSVVVALLAQLGRVPAVQRVDVALDLAIAKLGAMLPADAPPIEVRSPRFPLVPLGAHVPPPRGSR